MVKTKTSILVEHDLWVQVKMHCAGLEICVSDYIERLIRRDIQVDPQDNYEPVKKD